VVVSVCFGDCDYAACSVFHDFAFFLCRHVLCPLLGLIAILIGCKIIPRFCAKFWNCTLGCVSKLGKPGRKREKYSVSGKRRFSSDARIVVALLKKQPQSKDELCKGAAVSKSAFYRLRPMLMDSGIIKEVEGGYALWTFSELEKTVEDALFRLVRKGYRITLEDLTNEAGRPWSEIENVIYAILKRHRLQIKTVNGRGFIDGWYGRKDLQR